MGALAAAATPLNLLRPTTGLRAAPLGSSAAKMKSVAQEFEATFIGQMLQPMFDSLSTAPPFGGGEGESAYRSFFVDAVAKQMVKAGGIGLAASVQREMVRMQAAGAAQGAAQSVASGQAATPKSAQTPKEESTS